MMRSKCFLPPIALGLVFTGAAAPDGWRLACAGFQAGKAGKLAASRLVAARGSPILIAARALAAGDVNRDRCADLVLLSGGRIGSRA